MTIEQFVRRVLTRLLPPRVGGDAAADLLDEHRHHRAARGSVAAAIFLLRETASLLWSSAGVAITDTFRSVVLWRRDAAHAFRSVRRRPWATLGSTLMLAMGLAAVGASTGFVSTLLFRPISARYPDAVWRLASVDAAGRLRVAFAEPELAPIRSQIGDTATVVAANLQPVVIRAGGADLQTLAEVVAGRYFDIVGPEMSAGRPLVDGDGAPGAPAVAVISETLWRDRFGRDPAVIGGTVRLNGRAFTIVGVTAGVSSSSLLGSSVDAWIAVAHADVMLGRDWRTNVERRWWTAVVHVPPASLAALDAALVRASSELAAQVPDAWRERRALRIPGTQLTGTQRRAATTLAAVLAAFAALILLAAAANVGGLFLAAFAGERGRAAIQLAIGSGRGAVVRRHVVEGAIIGAASGVVAVAVYAWIRLQLAQVAILPTLSLRLDLSLDWRVIGAVIAAGTTVGALLSLAPALWVIQLDLATALRDGAGRISAGTELSRTRRLLVAIQIAVSIALVAGAALFSRSVDALDRVDVGFERHGLFAMDFDVEPSVASPAMLPALAREALERTAAVPGVTATAMANRAPIDVSTPQLQIALPAQQGATPQDVTVYEITERYFETVGLPIVHGRAFTAAEVDRSADLIIVNQTLAARLWPNGDVLDRALVLPSLNRTVRVIGVARDSRYRSLSEPPSPHVYRPIRPAFSLALLVRTRDDPRRAIRAVQEVLDRVGPGVVGFFPRTLDDHLAIDMLTTKAAARASTTLGAFALLLSAAGLYGIVAWFVAVRRREIAVRMALGASAADVRWLVVRQAVAAAAPGLIIGWTIAIGLTAFGGSLFVGVGSLDPNSLLLGGAALVLIVIAASYWPSRKATQVDPVIALRDS